MPQLTFERVEKKYLLTPAQLDALAPLLHRYMQTDQYGRHTICNVYYDTPDYRLIRTSLQKPVYKEKLRLRSYGVPQPGDIVFVELKMKYRGVVYKRRTALELTAAERWLAGSGPAPEGQIPREIDYVQSLYRTVPAVFLAYDRVALFGRQDPNLRLTLEENIRWRTDALAQYKNRVAKGFVVTVALLPLMVQMVILLVASAGLAEVALLASPFGDGDARERELKITVPEALEYEDAFDDLFERYTDKLELQSVKTSGMGSVFELKYRVRMRRDVSHKAFLDALR